MMGVSTMIATLKKIADKFPDYVGAALYQEAQFLMTEAKRRTPVASDGGALRASGRVAPPLREGRNISVTLSFGGASIDYALAVHETPSSHDPASWKAMYAHGGQIHWTTPGTGPKFLESVINEARPHILERVAARVNLNKIKVD